ncbi:chromate efflux transporter [Roseateles sp.]|uniref:chromate efflux transporter n=1 Tax=Roseateles sp. TaxID=1971397 RepID=UPI0031DC771D
MPPAAATPLPKIVPVQGSPWQVLLTFLRLGLTSFGGPIAHLGYFRSEFVERRRWLDDARYSDLVALCQFLPGPASSQVGIAIGMLRAGWLGALAAWIGFTLPSAILLIAFGYGISHFAFVADSGAVHGLKVVAVAVVAQAVWGMARTLCPDPPRAALAILSALLALILPSTLGQLSALVVCAIVGLLAFKAPPTDGPHELPLTTVSRTAGAISLALFAALLIGLLLAAHTGSPLFTLLSGFFQTGALVFGGGHVVLPLLQAVAVPSGAIGNAEFLAGYGAAQAVPGPLFTFAAYLGTVMHTPLQGWIGGLVFLLAIFAPAFLLVVGALPFWDSLRRRTTVRAALMGVNAGVVGLLIAALYDPLWTSAIHSKADFGLALTAFGLLVLARVPPLAVVVLCAIAGAALQGF